MHRLSERRLPGPIPIRSDPFPAGLDPWSPSYELSLIGVAAKENTSPLNQSE
jgi:hypothetical protein